MSTSLIPHGISLSKQSLVSCSMLGVQGLYLAFTFETRSSTALLRENHGRIVMNCLEWRERLSGETLHSLSIRVAARVRLHMRCLDLMHSLHLETQNRTQMVLGKSYNHVARHPHYGLRAASRITKLFRRQMVLAGGAMSFLASQPRYRLMTTLE